MRYICNLSVVLAGSLLGLGGLVGEAPAQSQVPTSKAQTACYESIDRNAAALAKVQQREVRGCVTMATRGKLGDPPTMVLCYTSDAKNKLAKTVVKVVSDEIKRCDPDDLPTLTMPTLDEPYNPPPHKRDYDPDTHNVFIEILQQASVDAQTVFARELFGQDADSAIVLNSENTAAAKCQVKFLKIAQDCSAAKRKLHTKCKQRNVDLGNITDTAGAVATCLQSGDDYDGVAKEKARIDKKCVVKMDAVLGKECVAQDLATVFPGSCGEREDFRDCVIERINCRYCQELNVTNELGVDCDLFDDETANLSCQNVLGTCGDGFLDPSTEQCDDGNTDDGDCCSSTCTLDAIDTPCGDPFRDECTEPDSCDGAGVCRSLHQPEGTACPDEEGGNACTDNICDGSGACTHPPHPAGTACGSQADNLCTDPDTCDGAGACEGNHAAEGTTCETDGNECTTDECDADGICQYTDNSEPCDDGSFCNGADTCGGGSCSVHAGSPCDGPDDDANCAESCNEETDSCDALDPEGSTCSDGTFCNGPETCTAGVCGGSPGDPCVGADGDDNCSESCNEATQACDGPDPDGSSCDDGLYCNGVDTCSGGTCSVGSGDPCEGSDGGICMGTCNEANDSCFDSLGEPCPDDGSACTDDFCDGVGNCVHPNSDYGTACPDDGNECTQDLCNGGGTCIHPAEEEGTSCDSDGNICTDNQCNGLGACVGIPNSAPCDDGLYCNGSDTCGSGSCSLHAGNPCPGADGDSDCSEVCNEVANNCSSNDPNGSACNNGQGCDGADSCQNGTCTPSGVCCGTRNFTFHINSNGGGTWDSAEWTGGTPTQQSQAGCTVTVDQPSGNIDQVGTIGDNFEIVGWSGFASCSGSVQCLSCPPAGICNVEANRPSCSAALNGSGSARMNVTCTDP